MRYKNMKILEIEQYLDGGTIEIVTDKGSYCIDSRLFTETENQIYNGYPNDDNSNLITNSKSIKLELLEALKDYNEDKEWCDRVLVKILEND